MLFVALGTGPGLDFLGCNNERINHAEVIGEKGITENMVVFHRMLWQAGRIVDHGQALYYL